MNENEQLPALKVKPAWNEIKRAYLANEGSLRTLAGRFGVSLNTLEKRCAREGWRREQAALGRIVTAAAAETAAEQGRKMGLTAAAFEERSRAETAAWLDRIQALADRDELDVEQLRHLIGSWKATIEVGRATFRLDEHVEKSSAMGILMMSNAEIVTEPESVLDAQEPSALSCATPPLACESRLEAPP
jgi:hypothetical protein